MLLKKKNIKTYFNKYIYIAQRELKHNRIDNALSALYHGCALMHLFNFEMRNDSVEELISSISNRIFDKLKYTPEKCIMLFDSIASTNMALSMQYLIGLKKLGYKVVYVIKPYKSKDDAEGLLGYAREQGYDIEIVLKNDLEGVKQIRHLIELYRPVKILLHMANSDVYGAVAFENVEPIERYYINHGDEQFWVGASITDYTIEFRGMGLDTSVRYRGISEDHCFVNPYFPILKQMEFQGFDFEIPDDSTIIFSGGRFVKVYSESGKFLDVIRDILNNNKTAFFIFAGSGNNIPMLEYISRAGLSDRWKVIDYRSDLLELMYHVDLYLGTYPQSGALMAQYAAAAGVPIVEMDTQNGGVTEDMLPKLKDWTITMQDWSSYFEQINRLIADKKYRIQFSKALKTALVKEDEFSKNLDNILNNKKSDVPYVKRESNIQIRASRLLEAENCYLHRVPGIMSSKLMLKYFPVTAIYNVVQYRRYRKNKGD